MSNKTIGKKRKMAAPAMKFAKTAVTTKKPVTKAIKPLKTGAAMKVLELDMKVAQTMTVAAKVAMRMAMKVAKKY